MEKRGYPRAKLSWGKAQRGEHTYRPETRRKKEKAGKEGHTGSEASGKGFPETPNKLESTVAYPHPQPRFKT